MLNVAQYSSVVRMSVFQWKSVELFDLIKLPSIKLNDITAEITAHCCNRVKAVNGTTNPTLVLCDINGYVHVLLENNIKAKRISFLCCYNRPPIKLCALTTNNLLAVLTQTDTFSLCISIYDLNLIKREVPPCITTATLPATSEATFIQVEVIGPDKLFALGIGFDKGDVLLHVGNINRDLSLNIRRHAIASSSINGIQFGSCNQQSDTKTYDVFVVSLNGVYCIALNDKGEIDAKIVLDNNKNTANQCCTISQPTICTSFLVVGRYDAIYCFNRNCRGSCYAIEGQKQYLSLVDNHLIVVVKTHFGSMLIVIDIDNKLIVLRKKISSLLCIITGINLYYVLSKDESSKNVCTYNIDMLKEHNTNIKIRTLITNCMHDIALMLLKREGSEYQNAAYVRLKYGNNLLLKGSFTRAVAEYAQTIGVIKPYHIISKLLSSRHNDNLIQYINKLLKSESATIDHQKLLQSCFDREKLLIRIQQLWNLKNDATRICDFKQISAKRGNISSLIDALSHLQIDDLQKIDEVEILDFFLEYGRELLSVHYTVFLKTVKSLIRNQKIKNILRFLTIFTCNEEFCANLLSDFIENCSTSDEKLHYHLLMLYLSLWRDNKISSKYIIDFVERVPLRLENTLILLKAYSFSIEIGNLENIEELELIADEYKHFFKNHIKKNANLASLLTTGPHSVLMILQKICSSRDLKIKDIKSLLSEKLLKNGIHARSEIQSIEDLNYDIAIKSSLVFNYKLHPIEFRNRCCDICNQSLKMPSVYFLCQHSFHKDCLRYNYHTKKEDGAGCVLCNENITFFVSEYGKIDLSSKSCDTIKRISNVFASGMDKLSMSEECGYILWNT
ncbi:vacuolar protein sorting-associated protein 11 homolog [Drosophila montana]|uniref:vacuolar protein sorting-associated protein 11 homolog n=1 Tax=Drosophila montana TaxID=40370 RepID=UPI00313E1A92